MQALIQKHSYMANRFSGTGFIGIRLLMSPSFLRRSVEHEVEDEGARAFGSPQLWVFYLETPA